MVVWLCSPMQSVLVLPEEVTRTGNLLVGWSKSPSHTFSCIYAEKLKEESDQLHRLLEVVLLRLCQAASGPSYPGR